MSEISRDECAAHIAATYLSVSRVKALVGDYNLFVKQEDSLPPLAKKLYEVTMPKGLKQGRPADLKRIALALAEKLSLWKPLSSEEVRDASCAARLLVGRSIF